MTLPITNSERLHDVGDSISSATGPTGDWVNVPGGLKSRLGGLFLWYHDQAPAPDPPSTGITVTSAGVNGLSIAGLDAQFATLVTPFNPTFLLIEIGINDAAAGNTGAAFSTSYASVIAKALALNPAMKFALGSCLCDGELWSAGPAWGPNAFDTNISLVNTRIQNQATAIGANAVYLDWRESLLFLEQAINPAPGSTAAKAALGRATVDGVHPAREAQLMMADVFFGNVTLPPSVL
jgi:hypothetical protein